MGQFKERSELGIFEEPPAPVAQPTEVVEEAAPQAPEEAAEVVEEAVKEPEAPKKGRKKADK